MSNPYGIAKYRDTGYSTGYPIDAPAPVSYSLGQGIMGSYDGLILRPRGESSWKKYPNEAPLLKGPLFVPQGTPLPLGDFNPMTPPENSLFVFARNISSPLCASTYSTSTGQVCSNKWQRDYIGMYRGGNRTMTGDNEF
jgi:hypothetical protein